VAKLRFFASIREKVKRDEIDIALDAPVTLGDFLARAADELSVERGALVNGSFLYAVNQQTATLDEPVSDTDEVAALPPLSGGF